MSMSHTNCSHPKTPKARATCRKAQGGKVQGGIEADLLAVEPVYVETFLSSQEHMGRNDATRIAQDLFREHGLTDWSLVFDNSRRRGGMCVYRRKQISLSSPLMAQRTFAETRNTITHEIAHALVKAQPGNHHSPEWAAKHRELGGDGKRCFDHFDSDAPWVGTCGHGKEFAKYRQPKRLEGWRCRCVRGGSPIVWSENDRIKA